METIIIEHIDSQTSQVFKQLAHLLGFSVKTKLEKNPAEITNTEIIRRIEAYESGNTEGKTFTLEEFKQAVQSQVDNA